MHDTFFHQPPAPKHRRPLQDLRFVIGFLRVSQRLTDLSLYYQCRQLSEKHWVSHFFCVEFSLFFVPMYYLSVELGALRKSHSRLPYS